MNRFRAILGFVFGGGLLIFLAPYVVYKTFTDHLPWYLPVIVISMYALLSYSAFKVYWPRIKK